jgi:malonyl CoA-acyl carrier protein transacylase
MKQRVIACIFPAFGMKYRQFNPKEINGFEHIFDNFLHRAADVLPIDPEMIRQVHALSVKEIEDDLTKHYLCYLNNCTISEIFKLAGIHADYAAGYSMGLFSALYHSAAVSFEDGLLLMHHVCTYAHEFSGDCDYGMGAIIGIPFGRVIDLISELGYSLELADIILENVGIVSGIKSEIESLFHAARQRGAIDTKLLPVALPYHASWMKDAEHKIGRYLSQIHISDPQCIVISGVDQKLIKTADDIRTEARTNVSHHISWYGTMNKLIELGVNTFIESGCSQNLCMFAKNFSGDFICIHPKKIRKYYDLKAATWF